MIDWTVNVGTLLTACAMLVGVWLFSIKVVRTINGKFHGVSQEFAAVRTTMARIDERVKGVESDVARAQSQIDELARR